MLLSLGVISASVDLYTVVPTDKDRTTRLLCPTHLVPLKQSYVCSQEGESINMADAKRGMETSTGWVIAPEADKPHAEANKQLVLTPISAAVLSDKTFEGPSVYYLAPSTAAAMQTWEVLSGIVRKGKIALVAKSALGEKAREKLWKLDLFQGFLVLREMVYPEAIRPAPEILHVKVSKEITTLVDQFVENLTAEWDSLDVSDANARRFDEWMAAGKTIITDTEVPPARDTSPIDLLAALQEAVHTSVETKKKR